MNRYVLRAKGIAALAVLGLAVPTHFASAENIHQSQTGREQTEGAQTMSNTTESPQPGSLEYFNRPENFLADTSNLDMEIVRRSELIKRGSTEQFIRPDGSLVEINAHRDLKTQAIISYNMVISRPRIPSLGSDSPFEYTNAYDAQGGLIEKTVRFYRAPFGPLHEFKNGQLTLTKPFGPEPIIPIEKTRAAMLKETGVDLFDPTQLDVGIITAEDRKSQLYMVTFRRRNTRALVDPETGKIIFEATYSSGPEVGMNSPGEDLNENGALYKEVENLFRKKVSKDAIIFAIYRKLRAKDGKRFFEVFLQKPEEGIDIYGLTSYLFDIKTGKVLYKTEAHVTLVHSSTPHLHLVDEYEQHLKMVEAEKH